MAWQQIVGVAPERMVEFDDQMRVTFANAEMSQWVGSTPDEMIGMVGDSLFTVGAVRDFEEMTSRLEAGQFVETHWNRPDADGEIRQIHLAMSPRLADDGTWAGLFATVDDRTDVRLLDGLYQAALADLTLSRRRAIEASIRRLEEPLSRCYELIDRMEAFERACDESDAIISIRGALTQSVEQIRTASSAFTHSSLTVDNLGGTLIDSLGPLIEGRELIMNTNLVSPPTPHLLEVVFRVAREAAVNAVLHGGAEVITVALSSQRNGIGCTIHDNGSGLDIDPLQPEPGHLGIRAMKERARECGGTCEITQHPEVGTLVSLWLPEIQPA